MNVDRLNMDAWSGRVDPEADSPRWHQRIQPLCESQQPGLALLGFACDEGVRRNQGRVGAASAPAAIRKMLANLAWHRRGPTYDAGDICCADGDLDGAQQRLGASVGELLGAGHLPVVLGGGHEVAYGSWQGVAAHLANRLGRAPRLAIVNFDAHFDLRDPAHVHSSGTPFAQIAEACAARGWPFRYACLGVSRAANTRALFQRASELGVLVREDFEIRESTLASIGAELDAFIAECDAVYLTIDLDVLPAWEGPGVSAPAAHGVPLALLEPLIERLAASGKLLLAELAELNPEHDIDHRTARVAARLIHKLSLHG
ncbi:formimidoylglutamase [Pseudomonas oryzae]|uniref:Formimidoylglutamase n=1 Tax=Pseudomonas oryzae TaxID=1392877 RepID=A0A1H1Y2R5_9PSED|nr:formimidoylglutamase [Pseudomonas oryzae]SDT15725.1 formiminoglutamase [Pseudomonas oryzae]